jgi:hypothetical protein
MWLIKNRSNGLFLAKKSLGVLYTAFVKTARTFLSEEAAWKEKRRDEILVNTDKMRRGW